MTGWRSDVAWAAAAALLTVAVLGVLCWPLPLSPHDAIPQGYFSGGHVWILEHVAAMLRGARPLSTETAQMGFPDGVELRPVALLPSLVVAPLRDLLTPMARYNLALGLGFGGAAVAAHALLRALAARPAVAAAAAVTYALCPFALGAFASGQLAKVQHWGLPLLLWCWVRAAQGRWAGLVLAAPAAAAVAFSAPTQALWAPLAGAVLLPAVAWRQRERGWKALALRALAVAAALGLTAGVFVFARGWYEPHLPTAAQAFLPAVRTHGGRIDALSPVVTLQGLLLGPAVPESTSWQTVVHVGYLGLPGLALGLSALPWSRAAAGLVLVLLGGSLALGPVLLLDSGPALVGGMWLSMPAALLDAVDYPTARSGMYYRAALVGSLGVAVLIAGAASRLRWGAALAWVIAAAQVADAVRATSFLWPRPVHPPPGLTLAREMAADPAPGAVIQLPAKVDDGVGDLHLLTAVVHGRETSAIPRNARHLARTEKNLALLSAAVEAGGEPGRARLRAGGVRYVTWLDGIHVREGEADREALEVLLGAPRRDGRLSVWAVPQ